MKKLSEPRNLALLCATAGLLTLVLRLWMFATGSDDRGLLVPSHIGSILSWVVTVAAVVAIAAALFFQRRTYAFRPSRLNAMGIGLGGAGLAVTAIYMFAAGAATLNTLAGILSLAAALCALLIAWARLMRMRPHVLLHLPLLLFLLLFLLNRYRVWSAESELQRYFFSLSALVFVLLSAYQRAASEVGLGQRKAGLFFSCVGIYFCLAAVADPGFPLLYAGLGLWLLLDIYTLAARKIHHGE